MKLEQLIIEAYETANSNGHYNRRPEIASLMMHIVGETSEATEALLEGKHANKKMLELLQKDFDIDTFEQTVKNTAGDELADIIILAMSISQYLKLDLEAHIKLKMKYNQERTKHSTITQSYRNEQT